MLKRILFFLVVFSPLPVFAGEWSFDTSGNLTGLYGYADVEGKEHINQATGDAKVYLSATYQLDEETSFSLNADVMSAVDKELQDYNQGSWGEEVYGIADSPYGRLMLGQTFNVAYQFHNSAPSVGAIKINNSDIVDFIRNPNWVRNDKQTRFSTLNATYINTDGVAPKISYITPEYKNTMLGFTYVPEMYNRRGLVAKDAVYENDSGYISAIYNHFDISAIKVESSAGFAHFENNDNEYYASLNLSYGGWSLGGGIRKSDAIGSNSPEFFDSYRDSLAWDVGLGYEIGPYQVSLSYFSSSADDSDNQDEIIMLSNQYQLNKWFNVYLIAAHVDFQGQNANIEENNQGYALVTGLGLSF